MKLLVVGNRGFLGSSIGEVAKRMGHEVLGVARSGQPLPGWGGRYIQADALHTDFAGIIEDYAPDAVFHAAGTASVRGSLDSPLDDLRAAVFTWANVLDGVRRSGLRPMVVFPSSAAVYGNPDTLPVAEGAGKAPMSPYGFHKCACELVAQEYAECFGLDVTVCRIFSVFGAQQRRLLVWELYRQMAAHEPDVWLEGTGMETRDYLHINDLVTALLLIASARKQQEPKGRFAAINVASGQETSVLDLAGQMRDLAAPGKMIRCRGTQRLGDPVRWVADTTLLRGLLPDWQPKPLALTLAETVQEWKGGA